MASQGPPMASQGLPMASQGPPMSQVNHVTPPQPGMLHGPTTPGMAPTQPGMQGYPPQQNGECLNIYIEQLEHKAYIL